MILIKVLLLLEQLGSGFGFPWRSDTKEETLRVQHLSAHCRWASYLTQKQVVSFASFSFIPMLNFHCYAFQIMLMIRNTLGMLITRDVVITANSFRAFPWKLWGYLCGNKKEAKSWLIMGCLFKCWVPDLKILPGLPYIANIYSNILLCCLHLIALSGLKLNISFWFYTLSKAL